MKNEIAKKCFIESEEYKEKFQKLFNNRNIMLIMMCNNLVLRIERMNDLCRSYTNLKNEYCNNPIYQQRDYSMYYDDFLIAEEIIYHARKAIDEMIYSLWMHRVGVENIDDPQSKPIDSIGRYLNQNKKILTEFDEYTSFFDDINTVSNSYKHSLCTFSPLKAEGDISFMSYVLRERDVDIEISQKDIIETVEKIFNKFLGSV